MFLVVGFTLVGIFTDNPSGQSAITRPASVYNAKEAEVIIAARADGTTPWPRLSRVYIEEDTTEWCVLNSTEIPGGMAKLDLRASDCNVKQGLSVDSIRQEPGGGTSVTLVSKRLRGLSAIADLHYSPIWIPIFGEIPYFKGLISYNARALFDLLIKGVSYDYTFFHRFPMSLLRIPLAAVTGGLLLASILKMATGLIGAIKG